MLLCLLAKRGFKAVMPGLQENHRKKWTLFLLMGLFMSCTSIQWWGAVESSEQCRPTSSATLLKHPFWPETFGKKDGYAYGCLQLAWGKKLEHGRGSLVKVTRQGQLLAANPDNGAFDRSPSLSIPSDAEGDNQRRFRLFVFGASKHNLEAQKKYCELSMAKPEYQCLQNSQIDCWFFIEFRPKEPNKLIQTVPIDGAPKARCKLFARPEQEKSSLEESRSESENVDEVVEDTSKEWGDAGSEEFGESRYETLEEALPEGACVSGQKEPCYTADPKTRDVGICKAGEKTCLPSGQWGGCQGERTPLKERCNGRDSDCDGQVDNGCPIGLKWGIASKLPKIGQDNGIPFSDICSQGDVLYGFNGWPRQPTSWLDAFQFHCAKVTFSVLKTSTPHTYLFTRKPSTIHPTRGKTSNYLNKAFCPSSHFLIGFKGREGHLIDQMVGVCAPLQVIKKAGKWTIKWGKQTELPAVGGGGGQQFSTVQCSEPAVMHGMSGRAGDSIDAFEPHCILPVLELNP